MLTLITLLVAIPTALSESAQADEAAIRQVLTAQTDAWNRGDIEGYMAGYWRSDELTFISGGELTSGWEATRARYQRRYPTAERMGRVRFEDVVVVMLGEGAAMVRGEWHLERGEERMGGRYTLVMKRFDEGWRVVHDHTSVGD